MKPNNVRLLTFYCTALFAGFLLAALPLVPGCATLKGADAFMVRVEQGQVIADSTVTFVLTIDQADRGFWRTNAPAFHNFCEYLRTKVPNPTPADPGHKSPRVLAIEENVHQLKETYKFDKSAGNSNALYIAFDELNTLVSQAASWSNIVTITTTHH